MNKDVWLFMVVDLLGRYLLYFQQQVCKEVEWHETNIVFRIMFWTTILFIGQVLQAIVGISGYKVTSV